MKHEQSLRKQQWHASQNEAWGKFWGWITNALLEGYYNEKSDVLWLKSWWLTSIANILWLQWGQDLTPELSNYVGWWHLLTATAQSSRITRNKRTTWETLAVCLRGTRGYATIQIHWHTLPGCGFSSVVINYRKKVGIPPWSWEVAHATRWVPSVGRSHCTTGEEAVLLTAASVMRGELLNTFC